VLLAAVSVEAPGLNLDLKQQPIALQILGPDRPRFGGDDPGGSEGDDQTVAKSIDVHGAKRTGYSDALRSGEKLT